MDAWGASACVYHGHDAADEASHVEHEAYAPQGHPHADHHGGGHAVQGHEHGAPVTVEAPSPDHPAHAEHCECRLRCIAVGALPPLEPEIIEVPAARPPQEDALSPVDLSTGVHAPATVPYLLPFSLAPPTRA